MADPRLLGTPLPFHFQGKDYLLAPRTFEVEAAFSVWLERQALQAIQRHAEHMSPLEYQQQLAGWRQDCAAGLYAYGTTLAVQAEFSPAGMKYMAYLLLTAGAQKGGAKVTHKTVDDIWDDAKAWAELAAIHKRLNDPEPEPAPKPPGPVEGQPSPAPASPSTTSAPSSAPSTS